MSAIELTDKTADRIRSELLSTLQELDRRRARATDLKLQVREHFGALAIAGGVLAFGLGLGIAVARTRAKSRRAVLLSERVHAFMRAWEHPRRVATHSATKPVPQELIQRMALVFATAFASRYAKQSAQRLLPQAPRPSR